MGVYLCPKCSVRHQSDTECADQYMLCPDCDQVYKPAACSDEDAEYLSKLADLARDTIEELVGPGEDKHYFEVDALTSLAEISECDDGTWVRGWVLVDNSQLAKAGLKDSEEDDDE